MTEQFEAHTPNISCDGCAQSIQRSLGRLPGVQDVRVDVENKNVSVLYDQDATNAQAIHDRLTQAGFPPQANA